ncbi:MAG: UDP-N-acetylglucosamine pyrophosphorylase [Lachnospiraceae bacterium]|nr:UDP-N-acetylglucosamine pyrophosphorylase [Lachnospiraceae bacterium]
MKELMITELYDLDHTLAAPYLEDFEYPWEALAGLGEFIVALGKRLSAEEYEEIGDQIWVAKSAVIAPTASIKGPVIIGKETEVRHGAFIRGNALVGDHAVVGNSTELKNVILFDHVQVPHYNYVGDSILGYYSHMGAGSITSNVKSDKKPVVIKAGETHLETGRKKVGGMLGDFVEVGCGTVINPGSVIGRNTSIYPLSMIRGYIPANSVYKKLGEIATKEA